MKALLALGVTVVLGLFVLSAVLPQTAQGDSTSRVLGVPQPTATPQTDGKFPGGLVQPSAQPTCGVKKASFYADPNGCIYGCADQRHAIVVQPLNVTCVFPTTAATATP